MFGKTEKEKQEDNKEAGVEYADYEICRKSKVGEYLQTGQEFFVADMKKKKIFEKSLIGFVQVIIYTEIVMILCSNNERNMKKYFILFL